MGLRLKTVAVMIVTFLVVVAVIIGATPIKKLAGAILGFGDDEKKNKGEFNKEGISKNIIAEIKNCLNNNDDYCYCSMSNTFIPGTGVVEFKNIAENLYLDFYSDVEVSGCSIDLNSVHYAEEIFSGSSFFFENSFGLPDVNFEKVGLFITTREYVIQRTDYVIGDRAYWTGSDICSSKDVFGMDNIDFSKGVLYKLSRNAILLTRNQANLRACGVNIPKRVESSPVSPPPALGNLL